MSKNSKSAILVSCLLWSALIIQAQTIGTFTSIYPGAQTTDLQIPSTHQFQKIIAHDDPINGGTMPDDLDYTAYVPIAGSSTNGYLSINSEATDEPGAVVIGDVSLNTTTGIWTANNFSRVDFSSYGIDLSFFGIDGGTIANCSGAVTPWGTVISCEEVTAPVTITVSGIPVTLEDENGDGYDDYGWAIEIDPITKTVIDKIWAMGKFRHENAAIDASNNRVVYQGVDNTSGEPGFLYKYIADSPGNLHSGDLFVYSGLKNGAGTWVQVPNTTQEERNNTIDETLAVGGTQFDGVEDVEIGPDGWVYFAVKREEAVYRFQDANPLTGTGAVTMETFVGGIGQMYTITHSAGDTSLLWGYGNDNMAFDGEGNLWVFQDGGNTAGAKYNDYIWVVKSGHTQASPKVEIFGNMPFGAEPTGITFTPDYKYLFMSVMHPDMSNSATSQTDMAGNSVNFAKDVAIVISRADVLLPVDLTAFTATPQEKSIRLDWTTATETNNDYFLLERSQDGKTFKSVGQIAGQGNADQEYAYQYKDTDILAGVTYYYRLKQVDFDGTFAYSDIVSAALPTTSILSDLRLSPNPTRRTLLQVDFSLSEDRTLHAQVINEQGKVLQQEKWLAKAGPNQQRLTLSTVPAGTYHLRIGDQHGILATEQFVRVK